MQNLPCFNYDIFRLCNCDGIKYSSEKSGCSLLLFFNGEGHFRSPNKESNPGPLLAKKYNKMTNSSFEAGKKTELSSYIKFCGVIEYNAYFNPKEIKPKRFYLPIRYF